MTVHHFACHRRPVLQLAFGSLSTRPAPRFTTLLAIINLSSRFPLARSRPDLLYSSPLCSPSSTCSRTCLWLALELTCSCSRCRLPLLSFQPVFLSSRRTQTLAPAHFLNHFDSPMALLRFRTHLLLGSFGPVFAFSPSFPLTLAAAASPYCWLKFISHSV